MRFIVTPGSIPTHARTILKLLLNDPVKAKEIGHDLGALITEVEKLHQATMAAWVADRLREFNQIDPMSDLFRYSDRPPEHPKHVEMWVDLLQVRTIMDRHYRGIRAEAPTWVGRSREVL